MSVNSLKHSWNWSFDKSTWRVFSADESIREVEPTFLLDSRSPIKILSADGSSLLAIGIKLENDQQKVDVSSISSIIESSFERFCLAKSPSIDTVEKRCYARVGILGNPSDGYAGKTLSSTIENFGATVYMKKNNGIKFELNPIGDQNEFVGLDEFLSNVKSNGYDGGIRLLMATTKVFWDALRAEHIILPNSSKRGFSMRYETNIPRQLGLAGSSAICTACFRALMSWYGITSDLLPNARLANYVLSAEQQELGIAAGLQDRVSQAYDRPVFMDFTPEAFKSNQGKMGNYEPLPDSSASFFDSRMFLLFPDDKERTRDAMQGKSSGKVHSPIRKRWEEGDPVVRSTMIQIAELAVKGKEAVLQADEKAFISLMNQNFDLRLGLFGDAVSPIDRKLIELARSFGPDIGAKLPGSGGAVLVYAARPKQFEEFLSTRKDVKFVKLRLRHSN